MKVKREIKYTATLWKCVKCNYEWAGKVRLPKECPNCKSRYWNGEEVKK